MYVPGAGDGGCEVPKWVVATQYGFVSATGLKNDLQCVRRFGDVFVDINTASLSLSLFSSSSSSYIHTKSAPCLFPKSRKRSRMFCWR
jgi:hypothetical protein